MNATDLVTDFYDSHPTAIRSCIKAMETAEEYSPPHQSCLSTVHYFHHQDHAQSNNYPPDHTNLAQASAGLQKQTLSDNKYIQQKSPGHTISKDSQRPSEQQQKHGLSIPPMSIASSTTKHAKKTTVPTIKKKSQNLKEAKEKLLQIMIKDFVALDNHWKQKLERFDKWTLAIYFRKSQKDSALYLLRMHPQLYFTTTNLLKSRKLTLPNPNQAKWACSSLKYHKELRAQLAKPCNHVEMIPLGGASCYDPPNFSHLPYPSSTTPELVSFDLKPITKLAAPPVIFPNATPPELMGKAPLLLNLPSLLPLEDLPPKLEWTRPATPEQTRPTTPQWTSPSQVVMTRSPSPAMSIYPTFDLSPVAPLPLTPWNAHRQEHFSMEQFTEPPIAENPLEDQDSPIEDAPTIYYLPDNPEGNTHTLHPERSPAEPWKEYLEDPSPVSHKHSLSPTSPNSAPIQQHTSREGSYYSITPTALSPIASTSPQSQNHQSTSSEESADNPSPMQSSADDMDNDMALNWVTINTDYLKG